MIRILVFSFHVINNQIALTLSNVLLVLSFKKALRSNPHHHRDNEVAEDSE